MPQSITREELFNQFQTAANLMRRYLYRAKGGPGEEGFEHGQSRLMRLLEREEGLSQKELAEKMRIRPSSLSELLKKLEAKGYLLRLRNETDKRVYSYRLTESGRAVVGRVEESKRTYGQAVFSGLDDAESESLYALLRKVSRSLEENMANVES